MYVPPTFTINRDNGGRIGKRHLAEVLGIMQD
jgi:hypothetical protein